MANSGVHIRIMPIRKFDLTHLAPSQATALVLILADKIESHSMTEADLVARTHSGPGATMGSGNALTVGLLPDGFAFDDPASQFYGSAVASPITLAAAPSYGVQVANGSFARFLAVQLIVTTGTVLPIIYLSVDLVLKGGDPAALMNGPNSFRGYRIL